MASMGNLGNRMRLQCKPCGWVPPEGMQMEGVQLHFQVDHDTDKVTLDLVPACRCGEAMTFAESAGSGDRVTDFFCCGVCGNTGYVNRKDVKA